MLYWDMASHTLHDPGSLKFERFGEAGDAVGPYTAPNVRNVLCQGFWDHEASAVLADKDFEGWRTLNNECC